MTETATLTLTDFLLAQIAQDEGYARAIAQHYPQAVAGLVPSPNHPARVLAECEAKRRIVAAHEPNYWYPDVCSACHDPEDELSAGAPWPCPTSRALAVVYADHPDYREEWAV